MYSQTASRSTGPRVALAFPESEAVQMGVPPLQGGRWGSSPSTASFGHGPSSRNGSFPGLRLWQWSFECFSIPVAGRGGGLVGGLEEVEQHLIWV